MLGRVQLRGIAINEFCTNEGLERDKKRRGRRSSAVHYGILGVRGEWANLIRRWTVYQARKPLGIIRGNKFKMPRKLRVVMISPVEALQGRMYLL